MVESEMKIPIQVVNKHYQYSWIKQYEVTIPLKSPHLKHNCL